MPLPCISDIYRVYEALTTCAREHFPAAPEGRLGGKLLVFAMLDEAGAATALASSIAGAASLGLDPDAERLKEAMRHGVCDFVVNHLDEALRILKNEIRKKQPVSVGLVCDVAEGLEAMVERGVQPDLLAFSGGVDERMCEVFISRGAQLLGAGRLETAASAANEEVWWGVADAPARWLPKVDALAAEVISDANGADERLRWLRIAPRYLVRPPEHYVKFTVAEADRFAAMIEGRIPVEVSLRRSAGV